MAIRVVTDSTSYIPVDMAEGLPLDFVSLTATLDGVTWRERDMTPQDTASFYRRMIETREFPTSSQPSVAEIVEAFERPVIAGDEVVGVFISSAMSGTLATAQMAREQVLERHPAGRIEIVDSRSNSMELGFAALAAARAASQGMTTEQAVAAAQHKIDRSRWLFVPATLDYLKMGGRIGTASALLGTLLDIKPILTVVDGSTAPFRKVRTRSRAIAEIAQHVSEDVAEKGFGDAVVHHIHDPAAAADLAGRVEAAIGRPPRIVPLGPCVGLHVGPGSVGIVYWTIEEQNKNTAGVDR